MGSPGLNSVFSISNSSSIEFKIWNPILGDLGIAYDKTLSVRSIISWQLTYSNQKFMLTNEIKDNNWQLNEITFGPLLLYYPFYEENAAYSLAGCLHLLKHSYILFYAIKWEPIISSSMQPTIMEQLIQRLLRVS